MATTITFLLRKFFVDMPELCEELF